MVIRFLRAILAFLVLVFFFYLLLPTPEFPVPPSDSLQSNEPADTEDPLRRAYFTDLSRQEVLAHYQRQLTGLAILGIDVSVPTYRLSYPPEDAKTLIRDQTRSTFLEEIVHPFRESLFVNGFEPKEKKDAIEIRGRKFRQKITIRYVPTFVWVRVLLAGLSAILLWILVRQWAKVKFF